MPNPVSRIVTIFKQQFSSEPLVIRAPGRINLIGEHTDYNEGFVLPAAIDRAIYFAMAPSGTDRCNIYSADMEEGVSFSILDLNPGEIWINYLMGVMDGFEREGLPIHGVDCVFGGDIPVGGGLSSSAALCNGFGFGLNQLYKCGLDRLALAKISQYAEHEFASLLCGLMDQYASLFGEKNAALLLDCREQKHEVIPVHLTNHSLFLIDTRVKHSLASSAYNERREACEEGVKIIHQKNNSVLSLRDVSRTLLYEHQGRMDQNTFVKCLYVIDEIQRTLQAAEFLKIGQLVEFGKLMYDTHWGLSQAYDVSCVELDFLVALAEEEKITGARMMGGGFGGCTINLVQNGKAKSFKEKVIRQYAANFNVQPEFYLVNLVDGVSLMDYTSERSQPIT
ncbi:MAG: galactokinase [Cyclobacteriaceae bacterium]|nr:galactokinase [Cyclobacteriaceae bacterium]